MIQYISKSALVAEIEKRKNKNQQICTAEGSGAFYEDGFILDIINSLDTLKVKEVDLDYIKDELDKVVKIYKPDGDFGWGTLYNVATHFFELGLKAQKGE